MTDGPDEGCPHADIRGHEEMGHGLIYACTGCHMQFIPGDMYDRVLTAERERAETLRAQYDMDVPYLRRILAEERKRVDAVRALPDTWDDAARTYYYDNRHTERGVDYSQGFEEGWYHAADLLRAVLSDSEGGDHG